MTTQNASRSHNAPSAAYPKGQDDQIDPELERLFQDIKRLNNGIAAVEERLMRYLAKSLKR